ncbi:MAG TPA: VWA domain-containing protein [Vicinamibacteria bacterium]|nr:VWA domain-containing protein [Vicinamibacteria bacterium]
MPLGPCPAGALAAFALAALALTRGAAPRQPQAPPQAPTPPVFGAGVELVRLDVVVLDGDGRPVTGLSREDFRVEEEGRPQTVESFEPVVVRGGRPVSPDEPPRLTGARLRAPSEGRCLLFFVDDIHVAPPTMAAVRDALRRFLEADVREGDWITVVAPEEQLWWTARNAWEYRQLASVVGRLVGQGRGDTAADWATLHAVEYGKEGIGGMSAALGPGSSSATESGPGRFAVVGDANAPVQQEQVIAQVRRRTEISLGGLQQALESLVRLRGQKALVLLSEGFLLLPKMSGYREAIDIARRANVAIHFVDPRGVQADRSGTALALTLGNVEGISAVTGGTVFSGNDAEAGLRRVAERSDAYYLLGYQPDRPGTGERQVKVAVSRQGLGVRARSRYYVPEPPKKTKSAAPSAGLVAMRSLADTTDLPVRTATLYFESNKKGEVATMLATEVLPPPGRERRRLFKLVSEARARDGGPPVRDQFEGSTEVVPAVPVILARQWQLAPGVWQARLLVEDATTGRIGTVLHTFEVPDPKVFRMSTPILTAELEDPEGQKKPKVALARTFRTGTVLYCQYSVYGASVAGKHDWAPHALGGWTLRRGDELVREAPPTLIQPGGDGRLTRTLGISLQGASPGEYTLTLTVRDEKTGETLSRSEPFTVAP